MLIAEIFKTNILCTIQATGVQSLDWKAVLVAQGHICKLHRRTHTHILKVAQKFMQSGTPFIADF
jgi:hypothetical protein